MKMTWNISLFVISMICNFSKCDGLTVLWIISIKLNSVVYILNLPNQLKNCLPWENGQFYTLVS